jgi:hypothetical protein
VNLLSDLYRTMTTPLLGAIGVCVVMVALCGRGGPRSPWLLLMGMPSVLIGPAAAISSESPQESCPLGVSRRSSGR